MNVASMTAMVTIQGFTGLGAELDMGSQRQCRKGAARQSVTADTTRSFENTRDQMLGSHPSRPWRESTSNPPGRHSGLWQTSPLRSAARAKS